jgi:iron complex transport system substrate-binding protein
VESLRVLTIIACMNRLIILLLLLTCIACKRKSGADQPLTKTDTVSAGIRYATGFTIKDIGNSRLVDVVYPFQGATSGYTYLFVPKGEDIPLHDAGVRVIRTPVNSIVCTSTTHIPLLDYLNETDKLVGFTSTDYISSGKMRKRIDAGKVTELGVDKGINLERLTVLQPEVVMGYTMSSDYGQFKKVEELGIPVVINAEYLEKHPLGRAEWIRFMALLFNKENEADSIFRAIEKNYLETKAIADTVSYKPTVISGVVYGDAWFMPGGQNYASRILKDAGCNYLWAEDQSHGFLQLGFEHVYDRGHDADLWIGTATYHSLKEIADADHRYTSFKPFREKQVYTYDARMGVKGGNEFLELGYLRPDIILNDLVKIAHPELLPEYQLYFHRRLQ